MAEIIRINENTYRFEDAGVRFFLLEGTEKALLIDSGMTAPDARKLAESITSLPLQLLNTHADPDHTSGNAAFDEVMMGAAEEPQYRSTGGTNRVIPLRDGDALDLGGRTLEIIDDPGHTKGSIAILDRENRVLIGGDSIQSGNIYMFGSHRDFPSYIESLKRIDTMRDRFDTVYPSHGEFPASPEIIPKLIGAAEQVLRGEAEGKPMNLHGTEIRLYSFGFAGFYGPAEG